MKPAIAKVAAVNMERPLPNALFSKQKGMAEAIIKISTEERMRLHEICVAPFRVTKRLMPGEEAFLFSLHKKALMTGDGGLISEISGIFEKMLVRESRSLEKAFKADEYAHGQEGLLTPDKRRMLLNVYRCGRILGRQEAVDMARSFVKLIKKAEKARAQKIAEAGKPASAKEEIFLLNLHLRAMIWDDGELGEKIRASITRILSSEMAQAREIMENTKPKSILTGGQEATLFRSYRMAIEVGDEEAGGKIEKFLTEKNNGLIGSIAKKYEVGLMPFDDIMQEGAKGLLEGIRRFDYSKGYKLSTYANWWIKHAIRRSIRSYMDVPIPYGKIGDMIKVKEFVGRFFEQNDEMPTENEIAAGTGITQKTLRLLYSMKPFLGLSMKVGGGNAELEDFLMDETEAPPDSATNLIEIGNVIERALKELKPMEEDIIKSRFGIGNGKEQTLEEIAGRYNLSWERIRQLQNQTVSKMRGKMERLGIDAGILG